MKIFVQLGIVAAICLFSEGLSLLLPVAFPGSVIAMIVLFFLLIIKWIRVSTIQEVSSFFKENMPLFFLPSTVGVIDVFDILQKIWIPFLLICIVSTVLTFLTTAWTVKIVILLQKRFSRKIS